MFDKNNAQFLFKFCGLFLIGLAVVAGIFKLFGIDIE